jgi:hypothetical protein
MSVQNRDIRRDIHWGDEGPDVRVLQENLRDLAHMFDGTFNHAPQPDGVAGKHTFASARRAAYLLGLPQSTLDDIARSKDGPQDNVIRQSIQGAIRHPDDRTDEQKQRSQERRKEVRKRQEARDAARNKGLIVQFDGIDCPGWIVRRALQPARAAGVQFTVISGVRDPDYSEHLCYVMCGQPSCPGRCAGKNSNHSCQPSFTCKEYEGAVDVSPGAVALIAWCRNHNVPLHGGGEVLGSADIPHCSHDGR